MIFTLLLYITSQSIYYIHSVAILRYIAMLYATVLTSIILNKRCVTSLYIYEVFINTLLAQLLLKMCVINIIPCCPITLLLYE